MKPFDEELVKGNIFRSVWKLSWPVVLLNLVNGMHGHVDHILIGHYLPSPTNAANAAIGVAWQVFLVVVVFMASLFQGMNVLVARHAGRQDRERLSKVVYACFLTGVYVHVFIVAPLGYFLSPHLLNFVEADPEVIHHALPYIRILFVFGSPMFLMFLLTGAFQASGDPKTPLLLGVMTTLINIGVSALLIIGPGPFPELGTMGAAIGTVAATATGAVIAIIIILGRKRIIQPPDHFHLIPDFNVIRSVARIGIPTGIQAVLLNIGGVFLLRFIGKLDYSASAQAAYTICYVQLFSLVTWTSFGLRAAASTLMGQNLGADQPERARLAVQVAAGVGAVWAAVVGLIFWNFPEALLWLFQAVDEPIRSLGVSLLRFLSFSGVILAVTLAFTGGLQGAGETKTPMYIAFLTQIVVLLGYCLILEYQHALTADRIWFGILLSHSVRLIMTYAVFRKGRWALIRLELDH
ncbi:MAG: MATE family efflux transporter [Candidatus Hydrogenedentes bacterium]|nr:MATE family efflux transporter [Candidatus Hydrogenedentota bacterium]